MIKRGFVSFLNYTMLLEYPQFSYAESEISVQALAMFFLCVFKTTVVWGFNLQYVPLAVTIFAIMDF